MSPHDREKWLELAYEVHY